MGSIMKMFKTSKKPNGNKENQPSVTFNTNSLKSTKSKLNDSVYVGDPPPTSSSFNGKNIDPRLKSPYAVITAPKTTRGPRSCPGAPMEVPMLTDRKNVMQQQQRQKRVRDDSELNEIAYRNMLARQQYDMTSYESDEDEVYEARIRTVEARNMHLENKLKKMHRRMSDERSTMTQQIEILQEENYRLKKNHDRMHRQYSHLKQQIEIERKQKSDLLKMLHDANNKIAMFEAGCEDNENDESVNTSSLLCPFSNNTMERSSEGAGEALCFPESSQTFSMFPGMTIINNMPNSIKDDMDTQDEVRVFRTSREDNCSPIEIIRRESSPFEEMKQIMNRGGGGGQITRSQSDTNLANPEDKRICFEEKEERPQYVRKSSWIKRNSRCDEDMSTSDSDEERANLIEKQLKKKGGLVKFNPPRQTVQAKHYKRFGKNERTALAEFEYLQDMSTDVSGMMSSPEVNQLVQAMSTNTFPPRHF